MKHLWFTADRKVVFGCLTLLGLGLCACASDVKTEDVLEQGATTQEALQAPVATKPVDPSDSTTLGPGAAPRLAFMAKAPPMRRATVDEVEDLNGTFRTPGSRDRLLQKIRSAPAGSRAQLVAQYNNVVPGLAPADQDQAKAKLTQLLGQLGSAK